MHIKNLLIYLEDIKYKYLVWIRQFIYTGQCDGVEETEIEWFLSFGKVLGLKGLWEMIVNNSGISMGDDFSEVQSKVEVKAGSKRSVMTSNDTVIEKGKREVTDISDKGNIKFDCNKCDCI